MKRRLCGSSAAGRGYRAAAVRLGNALQMAAVRHVGDDVPYERRRRSRRTGEAVAYGGVFSDSCLLRSGRGRPRYGAKGKLRLLRNVSATPEFAEVEPTTDLWLLTSDY